MMGNVEGSLHLFLLCWGLLSSACCPVSENYCFIYSVTLSSVREGRLNLIPVAPFAWHGEITRKELADSPSANIGLGVQYLEQKPHGIWGISKSPRQGIASEVDPN